MESTSLLTGGGDLRAQYGPFKLIYERALAGKQFHARRR